MRYHLLTSFAPLNSARIQSALICRALSTPASTRSERAARATRPGWVWATAALIVGGGLLALPPRTPNRTISPKEMLSHTSPQDAWVIIDGVVYDVTNWLPKHKAGAEAILAHAGQDITRVFEMIHKTGVLHVVEKMGKVRRVGRAESEGQTVA